MTIVVEVSHLSKRFGKTQAVDDVSFAVNSGEIFGLLGPNGAGKTTTIRMMLDIFKPDNGTVRLFDGTMDQARKRRIGYLPEERGLYKDQPLDSILVYLATLKGMDDHVARNRLNPWLERLDLLEHRKKKVQELSKGMQQKAQIIATLLHEPDLIIIDEPFSGLDPVNTRLIQQILEEQRQAGKAILMSTHQMNQVEALCTRIVLINQGRSVLYGEVDEIKRQFAGNAVLVEGQGDFNQLPGVLEARNDNGAWHLALGLGVDPQAVFREIAGRPGIRIERFELAEASLDDIFIQVVAGQPAGEEAENAA
ncbi:MAG: ATP-binding cassette domain-containing protein [Anaerolineales bacterium]|nr:ATP-binding cassette domain-containing protein [Anaerolineales bacterium]